MTEIWFSLE